MVSTSFERSSISFSEGREGSVLSKRVVTLGEGKLHPELKDLLEDCAWNGKKGS